MRYICLRSPEVSRGPLRSPKVPQYSVKEKDSTKRKKLNKASSSTQNGKNDQMAQKIERENVLWKWNQNRPIFRSARARHERLKNLIDSFAIGCIFDSQRCKRKQCIWIIIGKATEWMFSKLLYNFNIKQQLIPFFWEEFLEPTLSMYFKDLL